MGRIPGWSKGQMRNCAVCDDWYGERDYRMKRQEGKWVCKWCYEKLTDKERLEALNKLK